MRAGFAVRPEILHKAPLRKILLECAMRIKKIWDFAL